MSPTKTRTIVSDLPWARDEDNQTEAWTLDIDGVFVWVKNYGPGSFQDWQGWRVGSGGTPHINLNEGQAFASREDAMRAGARVARVVANQQASQAHEKLGEALRALRDVTTPL